VAERTHERYANTHGEATLAAKLDADDEAAYERPANAYDEARLVAKRRMNAPLSHMVKLRSNESSCKALSARLASRRSI